MANSEKTIFISYRRSTSRHLARAVFMDLRANGYDVFMDVDTIDSGTFDTIILNQIAARAHFILLLTPGTLERCSEPGDWLRREIEHAMDLKRNIVPILEEGFSYTGIETQLTDKLNDLPRYNGVLLYHAYFDAAMENLRTRFLKQPVYQVVLTPIPITEQVVAQQKIDEAAEQLPVTPEQVEAKKHFNQGVKHQSEGDYDRAIDSYSEAIRLNSSYARAYLNRGMVKSERRQFDDAILDLARVIRLDPHNANAFYHRGWARHHKGNLDGAIADYSQAIQLNSQHIRAYSSRGWAYYQKQDYESAISDHTEVIRLNPKDPDAYNARGGARYHKGDYRGAIDDYIEMIRLNPNSHIAYSNRAEAFFALGEYDLALADFKAANDMNRGDNIVIAGLAITYHALNQANEARKLWKQLIKRNISYRDVMWVKEEHQWVEPLVEEARKFAASV